jgi:hypothetical protein
MSQRAKIITTILLLIFLGALSIADYYLSSAHVVSENGTSSSVTNGTGSTVTGSPTGGVKKQNGPDVAQTVDGLGFTTTDTNDLSFLAQIAGSGAQIHAIAVLKDGDRAGSITWIDSTNVKNYFIALKEALLTAFSPQMTDLKDETQQGENMPVRNYLTFLDPTLSTERLVFVRVRERLYEFHIATGKEDIMNALIDAMTTK